MNEEEQLLTLTLSLLPGLTQGAALSLLRHYGTAAAVFAHADELDERVRTALKSRDVALRRAESELSAAAQHGIAMHAYTAPTYPERLRQLPDAPLQLFQLGPADLSARRVVAVVGTRRITPYGKDLCRHLCEDLARLVPDVLVVSGLAYGVDIHAHRGALASGLPTAAVLAHGLDRIYPAAHRDAARQLVAQGALVTEYVGGTAPDKGNFVRRNRIVAGLADAVVVVESAERGGALITARLALDYHRDVFAFPGRTTDEYSAGCNALIRDNGAALVTSAEDIALSMRWADQRNEQRAVQRELFVELEGDEQRVADALRGAEPLTVNAIAQAAAMTVQAVSAALFELELKGCVQSAPGGTYRWLN